MRLPPRRVCAATIETNDPMQVVAERLRSRVRARGACPRLLGFVGAHAASISMWRSRVRISPLWARVSWSDDAGHTRVSVEVTTTRVWADLGGILGLAIVIGTVGVVSGWSAFTVGAVAIAAGGAAVTHGELKHAPEHGRALLAAICADLESEAHQR